MALSGIFDMVLSHPFQTTYSTAPSAHTITKYTQPVD